MMLDGKRPMKQAAGLLVFWRGHKSLTCRGTCSTSIFFTPMLSRNILSYKHEGNGEWRRGPSPALLRSLRAENNLRSLFLCASRVRTWSRARTWVELPVIPSSAEYSCRRHLKIDVMHKAKHCIISVSFVSTFKIYECITYRTKQIACTLFWVSFPPDFKLPEGH